MTPEWFLVGGGAVLALAFAAMFLPGLHLWCGLECRRCQQRDARRNPAVISAKRTEAIAHNRSTVSAWVHRNDKPRARPNRVPVRGGRTRVVL